MIRVSLVAVLLAFSALASAQSPPKDLQWTHAFDLASRKVGESEFSPTTQKFGVEALRDLNTDLGLYITEKGSIALAGGFGGLTPPISAKGPTWVTGLDLSARKAGEKEFTKSTKVFALEVFRDPNADNAVYITADGLIAAAPARGKIVGGDKAPKWLHSFDLNVRKGGVKEWKDAARIGLEVYRDDNTGNLIYISETGAIAVVPANDVAGGENAGDKAPSWLHGLDLAIRKADEPTFTKGTKKFGVEVFRDEANGNLVYLCETGSIAVVPGGEKLPAPTESVKEPGWSHGWNVKARRFGEKDFTEQTRTFGGEIFRDDNTGAIVAISEAGAISAAKK